MTYSLEILQRAQKELSGLPSKDYIQVRNSIRALSTTPRPLGCLKLKNREGWRLRIGHYRVIYEIKDAQQIVTILHVGHRRDIYR